MSSAPYNGNLSYMSPRNMNTNTPEVKALRKEINDKLEEVHSRAALQLGKSLENASINEKQGMLKDAGILKIANELDELYAKLAKLLPSKAAAKSRKNRKSRKSRKSRR